MSVTIESRRSHPGHPGHRGSDGTATGSSPAAPPESPAALDGLSPIWAEWLADSDLGRLTRHPLLQALERGELELPALKTLLIQHQHYSRHFTRYLCALISRLSDIDDVRGLTGNLLEEMGIDGDDKITHAELFQRTLRVVGTQPGAEPVLPQTQSLVRTMMKHCLSTDPLDGLAALCLGAEAIVPLVYRPILAALLAFGYGEDATEFFSLHIEEDEDHALTMLAIMRRLTGNNPAARTRALQVGNEVIRKRAEMFDAIWELLQQPKPGFAAQRPEVAQNPVAGAVPQQRFSSGDFWKVPSQLKAQLPERLHHPQVIDDQTAGAQQFSSERKHKVHIVDLPSNTISMTIGRLQPAESTRLHRHNYETVIYIIAGKGYSRIGNRIVEWNAGDAIYVPVWAVHQHVSTDTAECVYIATENAPLLQNLGGIALREELGPVPA